MKRIGLMLRALIPGAAVVLVLVVAFFLFGGTLPDSWFDGQNSRINIILFGLIAVFLVVKSTLMLRRMPYIDWLTISLAATNYLLAVLYAIGVCYLCWGGFRESSLPYVQILRLVLIGVLIWSTLLLANVPDPIYELDADPGASG